jgi:UDP-glucose 4-epimerase
VSTLITGGAGTLGRRVVDLLLDVGHDVVVLDPNEAIDLPSGVRAERGDVRDRETLRRVIRATGVDRIAHLAGIVSEAAQRDPDLAVAVNVVGTLEVLEAAAELSLDGVVVISSKAVIGPLLGEFGHPQYSPVPSDIPRRPGNLYGLTKLCLEQLAERFAVRTGLSVTALRFATMYGPGRSRDQGSAFGFVATVIDRVLRGEEVSVTGGDQRNDLLYVGDMAQSIELALARPRAGYRMFQIGSGRVESMYDVSTALAAAGARGKLDVEPGLDPSGRGPGSYYQFDIAPAAAELGYRPRFDLRTGVLDQAASIL